MSTTKIKSKKIEKKVVEKTVKKEKMIKTQEKLNSNKTLRGIVVSAKMQNTVVIAIERKVAHKLYGKLLKVTKRLKADTNGMDVSEGQMVVIEQTKPLSKDKNFKVVAISEEKNKEKKGGKN